MKARPMIRGGAGGAVALAERLGWMGSIDRGSIGRGSIGQEATVPGMTVAMIDVSVFPLQDMLTILGFFHGAKDGNWSQAVMDALIAWGGDRFRITVVPKADDPQTVSFSQEVFNRLQFEAQARVSAPKKPWWFWPAIVTGGIAVLFIVSRTWKKGRKRPVAELG